MAEKTFTYTFSVDGPRNLSFNDYSEGGEEALNVFLQGAESHVCMNRSGMLTLAKLLIKLADGDFSNGFSIPISKDFAPGDTGRLVLHRVPDQVESNEEEFIDPWDVE